MVAVGLKLKVTIDDIGMNGEGIAHFEGYTLFVPFALLGGVYRVRVQHVKGNVANCSIVSEIIPSMAKIEPPCKVFYECGGCAVQNMTYETQLNYKRDKVKTCLNKQSVFADVDPTFPSNKQYGYRNKLQLPVRNINGKLTFGFFREGTHDVVPMEHCILHGDWAKTLISVIYQYADVAKISAYDENTNSGLLRHVVARFVDQTLLLTLVINGDKLPNPELLITLLKQNFSAFQCGYSINTKKTNVIMFADYHPVFGADSAQLNIYGLKCKLSPLSFLQINEYIAGNIYNTVVANVPENAVVLDVYSGIGLMTALIAEKAKRVYGIEVVPSATINADEIMLLNGIKNVSNVCGDAAEKIASVIALAKKEQPTDKKSPFVIVLDPPRKGCDRKVLSAVLSAAPDKILYVSCSPATLARDLAILTEKNYTIDFVKPYDMFPQTHHVETLCLLRKQ